MMTAECMLSKRAVLRFIVTLFFLLRLFSFHIHCIGLLVNGNYITNANTGPEKEKSRLVSEAHTVLGAYWGSGPLRENPCLGAEI